MKKIIISIVLIMFGGIIGLNYYINEPKTLDPPIFKKLASKYSSDILLEGVGFPRAKVLFYVEDKYVDDTIVSGDGKFSKIIKLTVDEKVSISGKQVYKNISSSLSDKHQITVDVTPPDKNLFKLDKEIPETTKSKEIVISGQASPNDYVLINNNREKTDINGHFSIKLTLNEGNNKLDFYLEDEIGNKTEILNSKNILVDSIPPSISSYYRYVSTEPTQESVVIDIDSWHGYIDANNSVPITGNIKGKIKKITLDGKNITWDENNNIYQRVNLYIYGGLNKYKVVVEDMAGNISTGYVETTAELDSKELNVNLNQ